MQVNCDTHQLIDFGLRARLSLHHMQKTIYPDKEIPVSCIACMLHKVKLADCSVQICHLKKKKDAEDYLQNIKAYVAILVNIGMEAKRVKFDSGRFEGVVRRELQSQLVGKPLIYSSSAALDGTNP
jgi:hypothetical protein